jgi:hypothetical protein
MPPTTSPVASPTALLTGTVATPAPSISAVNAMCQFLQLCDLSPTKAPSVATNIESPLDSGSLAPTAVASSTSLLDLCVKIGLCIPPDADSSQTETEDTISSTPATPYPSPTTPTMTFEPTSETTQATSEPTQETPKPTLDPTMKPPENLCEMAGNCPPSTTEPNQASTPPKQDDAICEFLGNCSPTVSPSVAATANKPEATTTKVPSPAPTSDALVVTVTVQPTSDGTVSSTTTNSTTTTTLQDASDLLCATVGLCNLGNGHIDLVLGPGTGSPATEPSVNTTTPPVDTNTPPPAPTTPNLLCRITGIC